MDMPRETVDAMRAARKTRKLEQRIESAAVTRPGKKEREAARAAKRERIAALNADMGKRYDKREITTIYTIDRVSRKLDLAAYKSVHRIGVKSKPRLHGGKWDYLSN